MRAAIQAPLPSKHSVLGVAISATTYGQALSLSRRWVDERRAWKNAGADPALAPLGRCIFVCNVHSVMSAVRNPEFKEVLNSADIATPDGMPLAWALRVSDVNSQPRVYGPDLMLALCGQAARLGHRIFLYGGDEESLPVLCRRLRTRFPAIDIVGAYPPPFRALTREEDATCVNQIRDSNADILFVGIGMPKQELWIVDHRKKLPGVVMIGVGAAFNFHSGWVRQAPRWMQQAGLEWFFRLLMEPRRLWKRYVLLNPLFLAMWGLQQIGILRYGSISAKEATHICWE